MTFTKTLLAVSIFAGAVVTAGCGSGSHQSEAPQPAPVPGTDFQELLEKTIDADIPGLILHIDGPEIDFLGAAGMADLEQQLPMQVYHQMPAGSAGKKATALLVAMLHEDGLLDIDAPISDWLPDALLNQIPNSHSFTLRMLLNHTAGIHDYLDPDTSEAWFAHGISTIGELKTSLDALTFSLNKPAYFAPGEGFHYSNSGYLLASLVVDAVLGEHHHQALRERVLQPLGMDNTYYSGFENHLGDPIGGYIFLDGQRENTKPFYQSIGVADAPLVSTVSDMSALIRAYVKDTTVVTDDMRELLLGEQSMVNTPWGYPAGLGMFKEVVDLHTVYHHGGDEAGYKTTNMYIEDLDTTITLFANCNGYTACINKTDGLVQRLMLAVFNY